MSNRDRIRVAPLESNILYNLTLPRIPKTLEPRALLMSPSGLLPEGVIARVVRTGELVAWRNGTISNIDQRKALAALDSLEAVQDTDVQAELVEALKAWQAEADLTHARAAQLLGIPKRTYENIMQGRGFKYPQLMFLALEAFKK